METAENFDMIGRRAFARGSSVWARAFNQQLPRRMAGVFVNSQSFNFLNVAESPLNGFAEQYRLVDISGLISSESNADIADEVEEENATVTEIVNTVNALSYLGILRNCMLFTSTTQHYPA